MFYIRKEQMAINFANSKILKLCIYSWRKYTRHKIEKNVLKLEHEKKVQKMEMFINLAAMRNVSEEEEREKVSNIARLIFVITSPGIIIAHSVLHEFFYSLFW